MLESGNDHESLMTVSTNFLTSSTTAQAFRKNILERGGTEDPMTLYERFRGAEPSIEPLLKRKGLESPENSI